MDKKKAMYKTVINFYESTYNPGSFSMKLTDKSLNKLQDLVGSMALGGKVRFHILSDKERELTAERFNTSVDKTPSASIQYASAEDVARVAEEMKAGRGSRTSRDSSEDIEQF